MESGLYLWIEIEEANASCIRIKACLGTTCCLTSPSVAHDLCNFIHWPLSPQACGGTRVGQKDQAERAERARRSRHVENLRWEPCHPDTDSLC